MIRNLMNNTSVAIPAQYTMGEDTKRGTFVKLVYNSTAKVSEIKKADTFAEADGILVRDVVVTDDVAMGLPISDYDIEQDLIKKGEYAGIRPVVAGEFFITTEYDSAITATTGVEGTLLKVEDGILKVGTTGDKIVSLGIMNDAGHTVLGYRIIK